MPIMRVTNRAGAEQDMAIDLGSTVMEVLRDSGEVEAICGGQAVCATCHVHIEPAWMDRVGKATEVEADLLESSLERQPNSRLSCQIVMTPELDGLRLTVAPAEG